MKKLILIAAVVGLFSVRAVWAGDNVQIPSARDSNPIPSADYGGVDFATSSFDTNLTTVATSESVLYGVIFSSGNLGSYDFVDFWNVGVGTGNITYANSTQSHVRLYNVAGSSIANTANSNGPAVAVGFSGPPWPLRFTKGIVAKASSALYNQITYLFYKRR